MVRIKELREEKGLTQAELGKILGVSQRIISHWEKGTAFPQIDALIALSNFFDVSIDYLVGQTDDILYKDLDIDQSEIILIKKYRKLNIINKNKVLGYIDGLLNVEVAEIQAIKSDDYEKLLKEAREQGIKDRKLLKKFYSEKLKEK